MGEMTDAIDTLKSPRMSELTARLAAGDSEVVEHFWQEISVAGSPLVEAHPNHSGASLITFLCNDPGADFRQMG